MTAAYLKRLDFGEIHLVADQNDWRAVLLSKSVSQERQPVRGELDGIEHTALDITYFLSKYIYVTSCKMRRKILFEKIELDTYSKR